jgi:predicted nucleic acid-binding protein
LSLHHLADAGRASHRADENGFLLSSAAELAEQHSISVYAAAYAAAAAAGDRDLVSCDRRDLVSKGLAKLPHN